MNANTSIKLTLEQRKLILQLMNYSYTIPQEYHDCVAEAIKKYATKSYTDEAVKKMVQKSQSVANSGFLLREDTLSLFRGKFAEWLACIEYNSLKNSGSVIMTIVNPDETSKADLLHFIKVGDEFKAVAGPDIKSGGSTYVFNQWKKIVTSRYDIPMVDFDDVLTTEEGLKQLTKGQRAEFDELCKQYPKKNPIPSAWSNQDELRLRMDYFKSVLEIEGSFEYSPEIVPLLKKALANQANEKLQELDWTEFNKKCKEIFKEPDFSVDDIHETIPIKEEDRVNTGQQTDAKPIYVGKGRTKGIAETDSLLNKAVSLVANAPKPIKVLLAASGLAVAGGVAYKANPEGAKKAIKMVGIGFDKKIKSKPVTTNPNQVRNIAKETVKTITEVVKDVDIVEEGVKRASPIEHLVRGYTKANGTVVGSYPRGGK